MKIAMLGPVCWRTPPVHYGAWETVVSNVTEGLVARGVDVTLFASGDSITRATLSATCPRALNDDPSLDGKVEEYRHISTCYEQADQFDIIHNQYDFMGLVYSKLVRTPVVTTVHGFSSPKILPIYQKYDGHVTYVSISNANRSPLLHYAATVYNGIDMGRFTRGDERGDELVWLGRFSPEKGPHLAIEVAKRTGRPLILAGIMQYEDYFETMVKPHIDGRNVTYIGPVNHEERNALLSHAHAMMHLITFSEPFGLTMIEALACGAPVIATPLGSVPEIVRDGRNGFIVDDVDGAVAAVERVSEIDRAFCRSDVGDRFGIERMVDGYLHIYERVLAGR